jgi:four helix bundle suffix protein
MSNRETHYFVQRVPNYKELLFFRKSVALYDVTFAFCERYLTKGDRTIDQMVQAARSGKQNIIEGSEAAPTSSETEIKLLNVARASLKELQADYEDYLRARKMTMWDEKHARYEGLRKFCRETNDSEAYMAQIEKMNDEEIANLSITLIHQAMYMLHKLLLTMQDRFVREGGIKERMYNSRVQYRNSQSNQKTQSNQNNQKTQNKL